MKAEHRKELQTNVLADRMGRLLQSMKSGPRKTSSLAWLFVLLAAGTFVLWQYYARASQTGRSALWVTLESAANNPADGDQTLQKIADANPNTIPARVARLELARRTLQEGQTSLALDRPKALEKIQEAQKLFAKLGRECVDAPLVAQEALLGAAAATESLVGAPKPDEASEVYTPQDAAAAYETLAEKYPGTELGQLAQRRAESLREKSTDVETFYAELKKHAEAATKK
jgi:hypothetical protein